MKGLISFAIRNLGRNMKRNLATGAATAMGFVGLLILGGYGYRVFIYLQTFSIYGTQTGHLVIYHHKGLEKYSLKPKNYSLTSEEQSKITPILRQNPEIEFFGRQLDGAGIIGNGCQTFPFFARGLERDVVERTFAHPQAQKWNKDLAQATRGKGFWKFEDSLSPIQVSVGLAKLLRKPKVHEEIPPAPSGSNQVVIINCQAPDADSQIASDTNVQIVAGAWSGSLSALDGEIVGHFTTGITDSDYSAVNAPLSLMQKLYDTDHITRFTVWLKDGRRLQAVRNQLESDFRAAGLQVDIHEWTEEAVSPMYAGTIAFLKTLVGFIAAVLLSVIVLSVFNSATITIIERSAEIGMLRSLGFTRGRIHALFTWETLALAVIGVLVGGVIGIGAMVGVNSANIRYYPPGIAGGMQLMLIPHTMIILVSAVAVILLAVLSTIAAVRTISRKDIPNLIQGAHR
jgi:putative ABC transport system permease protein